MRRFLILILFCAGFIMYGETLFVHSRVCPVQQQADLGSSRVGVLRQGAEVEILNRDGQWAQIKTDALEGFVQLLFLKDAPSAKQAGSAGTMTEVSTVVTRRRASAYSSSAAATRGLSSENVRDRENLSLKEYDFDSVEWLENLVCTEEEVVHFATSQGIGL